MIFQDNDSISHVNELFRQITIKESQLKIAREAKMDYAATALENQISELRHKLSESKDPEFHALMSLLDD